jgi:3'(2'), 5'-bisphosphate nucleotidase
MKYAQEKQIAIAAVSQAAKLCQAVRQDMPQAIEKLDKSPVTVADFGAQAIICKFLAEAFPHDPIVAEEEASTLQDASMAPYLRQATQYVQAFFPDAQSQDVIRWIEHGNGTVSDRYWTLDPIDGTKGFLRGDQYAIALALVEHGVVQVGVLVCPVLSLGASPTGQLLVAVRGAGAALVALETGVESSLHVTSLDNPTKFRFVESIEHGDQSQQMAVAQAIGMTQPAIQMDSQAKYAAVAAGEAALYLRLPSPKTPNYHEKIWDHAAGVLIVEEAGGRVTDMDGKPLDFSQSDRLTSNRGIIVSNGVIHDQVLKVLQESHSVAQA